MLSLQQSSFAREKKKVVETRSNFFWARFSKFPELFFFLSGFVFVFLLLLFRSSNDKFSVNQNAKTVKDKKISKIYLNLYDCEAFPDYEIEEAICSHKHLPSK